MSNDKKIESKNLSLDDVKNKLLDVLLTQTSSISCKKALKLSGINSQRTFDKAVESLLREGKVARVKKSKIVASEVLGLIPARIVSAYKNFSFASPLYAPMPDFYISADFLKGARVDDIVLLNHVRQCKMGLSARVDRILAKGNKFVKGRIEVTKSGKIFIADRSYLDEIHVSEKNSMGAQHGDKVQACIIKGRKRISAKITKIYGSSESAKICSDAIIDSYGIPVKFSSETIDEAQKFEFYKISNEEIEKRLDLRSETVFTMDGKDAKDLDDAISVKKSPEGYELGVHIADVSHFVDVNSKIDMDARERGTSVYFADRVIPMLPEQLSNGVCSLNAKEEKLTCSVILNIDSTGKVLSSKLRKSVIVSRVKGVYEEVNQIIDGSASKEIKEKYSEVMDSIFVAKELYEILEKNAEKRGIISFGTEEPLFQLDDNGVCVDVCTHSRGLAEKIIEQFMIKANEAVALLAKESELPFIYRIHPSPDVERVYALFDLARILGFKCQRTKDKVTTEDFRSLMEQAKGTKFEKLISSRILRSMPKAVYSPSPDGHFGLVLENYCHFTSPIRRYPDLMIHMILSRLLSGKKKKKIGNEFLGLVGDISDQSTRFEIRADDAERDAEKCYMAEYIRKYMGETFDASISGITQRGIFVELKNGIEGFAKFKSDDENKFEYDGIASYTNLKTKEKLYIGDSVRVKLIKADVSIGSIKFELELPQTNIKKRKHSKKSSAKKC